MCKCEKGCRVRTKSHDDIAEVILDEDQIEAITERLGAEISRDYAGKNPVLICILKGAWIFAADLMKHITIPTTIDFMRISSYGSSTVSSGDVNVVQDIQTPLEGRDVIIVEDMFDSGHSLAFLKEYLARCNPKSLTSACFLVKTDVEHVVDFMPDYVGHKMKNGFVVGYGLDYDERYRNLPYVGILKPAVYEKNMA